MNRVSKTRVKQNKYIYIYIYSSDDGNNDIER